MPTILANTIKTTNTIPYIIDGVFYSKTAADSVAVNVQGADHAPQAFRVT